MYLVLRQPEIVQLAKGNGCMLIYDLTAYL